MAMATAPLPPSQSLYIQNLPEKFQKDDLRRELYMLFSTYGPVLDVTALKTKKMRGQAHVLFRDAQSATQAMRGCQGNELGGREMRINYSKNRSDTLAKLTGTFNQPASEAAKSQAQLGAPAPTSSFPPPPGANPSTAGQAPTAAAPQPSGLPPPPGLPTKPDGLKAPPAAAAANAPSPQGTKRDREESEDEDDEEMDVEEDEEGAMEMSDDED